MGALCDRGRELRGALCLVWQVRRCPRWNDHAPPSPFAPHPALGGTVDDPGTGILLANPPGEPRASVPTVALVANENVGLTFFAAAGSGPVAETVGRIAAVTVDDPESDMIGAVAAPRVHTAGNPDVARFETGIPPVDLQRLRDLGHQMQSLPKFGRINGFYCPRGLPRVQTCQFVKDPRSFGLAVSSEE